MRAFLVSIVLAVSALIGFASPVSAGYCGASANGCAHAMDNTPCSGAGGFGAFGKDNNFAGGANGRQTGLNNSSLCSNRADAPGQTAP